MTEIPFLCDCLGPRAELVMNGLTRTVSCGRCFRTFDLYDLVQHLVVKGPMAGWTEGYASSEVDGVPI